MLRELIDGDLERGSHSWPVELRPALRTRGFAAELRDLLLRAVERGLTGPQLAELGRRQRRPDWVAAGSFLQQYLDVTALARPGAWDPAELIQAAVDVLRTDPTLLSHERRRRRRIFVDEYQDTDPAQTDLLGLVAEGADEIVVVGDPDQSIYAFRGADASALREMPARFGGERDVPVVMLPTSRRSGSALLAATRRIAARLPGPARQREISAAPRSYHPAQCWSPCSVRPPRRPPMWPRRCGARTSRMAWHGRGWPCWSAPPENDPGRAPPGDDRRRGAGGRWPAPMYPLLSSQPSRTC